MYGSLQKMQQHCTHIHKRNVHKMVRRAQATTPNKEYEGSYSHRVPYIQEVESSYKLCKNCKWFLKNSTFEKHEHALEHGYCKKDGRINLVTGEIRYESASITRVYVCLGTKYEPIDTTNLENKETM